MRVLTRNWNPWRELDQIQQEMSRLFGPRFSTVAPRPAVYPTVNLWGNENELALTAEIPGLKPEDLDVTVNRDKVTLKGARETNRLEEGESLHRQERQTQTFSRTLELPFEVDPQSAEATYEKGVLTLRLKRPEEHKPLKVAVKAN